MKENVVILAVEQDNEIGTMDKMEWDWNVNGLDQVSCTQDGS